MSAQTIISRQAPKLSARDLAAVLLLGIAGMIAVVAIVVTIQATAASRPAISVPAFDAVEFRAGERGALAPAFDAAQFRAGERADLAAGFDTVQFRAGERAEIAPAFDAIQFRAGERAQVTVPALPFDAPAFRASEKGL